ncbi:MAG: hypothetical protein EOO04_37230 [Chitinophagaceae bacterium]|nr:MAG: hypothetical protein EOO04_37230 [Chitinophagaceae bacterium]
MSFKAGTKKRGPLNEDQYIGSMANAMETAFLKEWEVIMKTDPPALTDHMRLIFIAVAQGVVNHMKASEESIQITMSGSAFETTISVEEPL